MNRPRRVVTGVAVLAGAGLLAFVVARGLPALSAADAGAAGQDGDAAADTAGQGRDATSAAVEEDWPPPTGQTAEQAIVDHNVAIRGPRQPIPFSHRFHVRELRIDCMYCHLGTETSDAGVVPSLEVCMGCHRTAGTGLDPIDDLRGHWERGEPVPWEWVNKLPDFVQFSHRAHLRTGVECRECHGPVEEMNRVYRWAPLTMGWCLDCHRSEPRETDVATDHLLVRESPPPEIPEGRQPRSLYPIQIDTKYAHYRAPIDCLACHY